MKIKMLPVNLKILVTMTQVPSLLKVLGLLLLILNLQLKILMSLGIIGLSLLKLVLMSP